MKPFARSVLAALIALPMTLSAETISVEIHGIGEDRDKAIANALERALPKALGSEVFYARHRSDNHQGVFSTAISQGLVESYEVVNESAIQDGMRVRVQAHINPAGTDEPIFQKVERWRDVAVDAARIDDLQKRMSRYQSLLDEFVGTEKQQLEKGYAIVPRGYEITTLSDTNIEGQILVDIIVNESWWNTYFDLLDAMQPITVERIVEGPVGLEDVAYMNSRRPIIGLARHVVVDASLRKHLASSLELTLRVPGNPYWARHIVLHKNALMAGVSVDWEDQRHPSQSGKRGYLAERTGRIRDDGSLIDKDSFSQETGGQSIVDIERSELSCHTYSSNAHQIFCGSLFVVGVPFEAADSGELNAMLKQGITVSAYEGEPPP